MARMTLSQKNKEASSTETKNLLPVAPGAFATFAGRLPDHNSKIVFFCLNLYHYRQLQPPCTAYFICSFVWFCKACNKTLAWVKDYSHWIIKCKYFTLSLTSPRNDFQLLLEQFCCKYFLLRQLIIFLTSIHGPRLFSENRWSTERKFLVADDNYL